MFRALAVSSPNHPNNKLAELTQCYAFTLIVLNLLLDATVLFFEENMFAYSFVFGVFYRSE